jgi:hypothetical protein
MLFNLQHKIVSTRTHLQSFCFPLKLCNLDVHLPVQDARFVELLHGVLLNCCTVVHFMYLEYSKHLKLNIEYTVCKYRLYFRCLMQKLSLTCVAHGVT